MENIIACLALQSVRRILLVTKDAHDFHKKLGFNHLSDPAKWLDIRRT